MRKICENYATCKNMFFVVLFHMDYYVGRIFLGNDVVSLIRTRSEHCTHIPICLYMYRLYRRLSEQ